MSIVRPADAAVVALAALLVGGTWATLWPEGAPAESARVFSPGGEIQWLELERDTVLEVGGRLGPSRLEVRDGRVRFVDSPCVNRICVHAGWLSRTGHVAACLPNGVVVEITGGEREFDAISY